MKAIILIISVVLSSTTAFATGSSVEKFLPNIRDRVRNCTVLPYHYNKNNVRVEQALLSHCPEVKLVPAIDGGAAGVKFSAKIRVAAHQYTARLIETAYSDGDFYDVEIRDVVSNEVYRIYNVLSYGDVLLGVLEGQTNGLMTAFVNE